MSYDAELEDLPFPIPKVCLLLLLFFQTRASFNRKDDGWKSVNIVNVI